MSTAQPRSSLVEKFRSDRKRLPLHPIEKAVLTALAVHLVFLPWAIGTVHPWSQVTSLCLAALGFVIALLPRNYTSEHSGGPAFRLSLWPKLVKFPLFWIGLALLLYIFVQGMNPSWAWQRNPTHWWLIKVDNVAWLPTSVTAPFERFNVWRQFIVYASAWLTVCTVWVGITRRRTVDLLIIILIVNAAVLAIAGFAQKVLTPTKYLGIYEWGWDVLPFASFIYKNHAGGYFALMASLAVAFGIYTHISSERRQKKSSPTSLYFLTSLLLFTAILASASRGATLTFVGFALGATTWYLLRNRFHETTNRGSIIIKGAVVLAFFGTIVVTARYMDFADIRNRFAIFAKDPTSTVESRLLAYKAGQEMLSEHGLRGVGAGGFSYLFPRFVRKYPAATENGNIFWMHVHRDWLEIPIELGAVGTLILLTGALTGAIFFIRKKMHWHALAAPVLIGCSQPLIHAWFDFPTACSAILLSWLALIALAARVVELDEAA